MVKEIGLNKECMGRVKLEGALIDVCICVCEGEVFYRTDL